MIFLDLLHLKTYLSVLKGMLIIMNIQNSPSFFWRMGSMVSLLVERPVNS